MAWYANDKRLEAEERARIALSRQLAALAENERGQGRLQPAFLFGAASHQAAPSNEARQSLQRAFAAQPKLRTFFLRHQNEVMSVAFSPNGKTLASASGDGTVFRWDVASHKAFGEPLTSPRRKPDPLIKSHSQPSPEHTAYNKIQCFWTARGHLFCSFRVCLLSVAESSRIVHGK